MKLIRSIKLANEMPAVNSGFAKPLGHSDLSADLTMFALSCGQEKAKSRGFSKATNR